MDYWLFFTSYWSLASSVNIIYKTRGDFHYKVDNTLIKKKKKKTKCVIGVAFHRWVMYCLHQLHKLEKGSTLQVHMEFTL